jgi:hypothetical protein
MHQECSTVCCCFQDSDLGWVQPLHILAPLCPQGLFFSCCCRFAAAALLLPLLLLFRLLPRGLSLTVTAS